PKGAGDPVGAADASGPRRDSGVPCSRLDATQAFAHRGLEQPLAAIYEVTVGRRECGDCTLCCRIMAIEALAKPAGIWCPHCKPGRGCLTYPDRPEECRSFSCLWLIDERFGAHWKPNKSKLVLTTSEDGVEIRCDPGFPDAWRREPFRSEIAKLATAGETHD